MVDLPVPAKPQHMRKGTYRETKVWRRTRTEDKVR